MSLMFCSAKVHITPQCTCPCHSLNGWFGIHPPCDGNCCMEFQKFCLEPVSLEPSIPKVDAPIPAEKFVEQIKLALKVGALEAERDRLLKENAELKSKLERIREASK